MSKLSAEEKRLVAATVQDAMTRLAASPDHDPHDSLRELVIRGIVESKAADYVVAGRTPDPAGAAAREAEATLQAAHASKLADVRDRIVAAVSNPDFDGSWSGTAD